MFIMIIINYERAVGSIKIRLSKYVLVPSSTPCFINYDFQKKKKKQLRVDILLDLVSGNNNDRDRDFNCFFLC